MAKPDSPLFSLEAHGSVANSITYQHRRRTDFARAKPLPANPRSLAQTYHRWDYLDYAFLWHAQSPAEKLVWRKTGSASGITGFNAFIRDRLNNLTNLALRLHLDTIVSGETPDSSKNNNTAIVYGATLVNAAINKGLSFDGVDDSVLIPRTPSLINFTAKTVLLFIKSPSAPANNRTPFYGSYFHNPYGDHFWYPANNDNLQIYVRNTIPVLAWGQFPVIPNRLTHVGYTWDGTTIRFYRDGAEAIASKPFTGIMSCNGRDHQLGSYLAGNRYDGIIDNFEVFNRALSPAEVYKHSQRRFP